MKTDFWPSEITKGEFYFPHVQEHKVSGVLLKKDGRTRLELIGTFSNDQAAGLTFERRHYDVMWGWLSQGGPITLVNCSSSESFHAPGFATEQINFSFAIRGHHFPTRDGLRFETLTVHLSNLFVWLGVSGLQTAFYPVGQNSDGMVWTARFVTPRAIEVKIAEEVSYKIDFTASIPISSADHEAVLRQDCLLKLIPHVPEDLDSLRARVYEFRTLFQLLTGFDTYVTFQSVTHSDVMRNERPDELHLFVNGRDAKDLESRPDHRGDALVPFSEVCGQLDQLVSRWRSLHKQYGDAIGTSLAIPPRLPLETRLLNLVNALHRYQESIAPGRVTVDQVLRKLLNRYCSDQVAERAASLIGVSRHYFTHFNPRYAEQAAVGADLANAVDLLDLVNRFVLLEELGFDLSQVKAWAAKSTKYRDRLTMTRWENRP